MLETFTLKIFKPLMTAEFTHSKIRFSKNLATKFNKHWGIFSDYIVGITKKSCETLKIFRRIVVFLLR